MFNQEAIAYLVGLGKEQVVVEAKNGGQYTPDKLYRIDAPVAAPFKTHTLTSVVDYIKSKIDELGEIIVHVASPTEVKVMSQLDSGRNREVYLVADAKLPNNLKFEQFLDPERFNIMLQSAFVNTPVDDEEYGEGYDFKNALLKVVGNIREDIVKEVGDTGCSQSAVVKTGVASVNAVVVPNPVYLAPYRTFQEVEQPVSKFIFRMQSGPKAALFEADGGMWENTAMTSIKIFLEENLDEFENVHILS